MSQDRYSNMETADVHNAEKVGSVLSNSPFDQHLIIDIPPKGRARWVPRPGTSSTYRST